MYRKHLWEGRGVSQRQAGHESVKVTEQTAFERPMCCGKNAGLHSADNQESQKICIF
jgi:hypothetical protein